MIAEGNGWYSYFFEGILSTNLIFNNTAAPQTTDLFRNREGWYYDGSWYDTQPNVSGVVNALFDDVMSAMVTN